MKRLVALMLAGVVGASISLSPTDAAEGKADAEMKIGVVKRVDADAGQLVVMVASEMTFTVTADTKIAWRGAPLKLTDIAVDEKVSVVYVKEGDAHIARRIAVLGAR